MKREKYSHAIADAKKRRKRAEAEARQEERNQRSTAAQLAKLDAFGYAAIKERARLNS